MPIRYSYALFPLIFVFLFHLSRANESTTYPFYVYVPEQNESFDSLLNKLELSTLGQSDPQVSYFRMRNERSLNKLNQFIAGMSIIIPTQFLTKNFRIKKDNIVVYSLESAPTLAQTPITNPTPLPPPLPPPLAKPTPYMVPSKKETSFNISRHFDDTLFSDWQPTFGPKDDLALDVSPLKFTFSLSPFKVAKAANEKDISYGFKMNYKYQKYELAMSYDRSDFSTTDILTKITVLFGSHVGLLTFDVNKIWKNLTYFVMLSYQRKNEGKIFIIENNFQIGPFGLKYKFFENEEYLKELSLSVIPLYEIRSENILSPQSTITNRIFIKMNEQVIRMSGRLRWYNDIIKNVLSIRDTFFIRPSYHITQGRYADRDLNFENEFQVKVNLTEFLSIKYENQYIWDRRNSAYRGIPLTDLIQSIKFDLTKSF